MTAQNPPIFLQAGSHPAEDVRRFIGAVVDNRPGVVASSALAVTQNGTPNMSVNVAGGQCFVAGSEATYQGLYFAENRGTQNVIISAANATNPRRDLIVARIRDAAYSGATNTFAIEVVTGTAAASPVDPATPANSLLLARVSVAANATTITTANIADLRTRTSALGAPSTCTSSTRPASPSIGSVIYETDTASLAVFNSSSAWEYVPSDSLVRNVSMVTKTATATLALTDAFKLVEMNVATGNTLTVPTNAAVAFPVGTQILVLQIGAGQTTFAGSAGVTLNSSGAKLKLSGQWSAATLVKRSTDTWVLMGDLAA